MSKAWVERLGVTGEGWAVEGTRKRFDVKGEGGNWGWNGRGIGKNGGCNEGVRWEGWNEVVE